MRDKQRERERERERERQKEKETHNGVKRYKDKLFRYKVLKKHLFNNIFNTFIYIFMWVFFPNQCPITGILKGVVCDFSVCIKMHVKHPLQQTNFFSLKP